MVRVQRCGYADENGVALAQLGKICGRPKACGSCCCNMFRLNAVDIRLAIVERGDFVPVDIEASYAKALLDRKSVV